jgi:phosphonate transport system substrate-binding protein
LRPQLDNESLFYSFDDLRGARWAYNEPASHSGYHVVRAYLASQGLDGAFFGEVLAAGSHEVALRQILAGKADAAAIDSTVLELQSLAEPQLINDIRVIASLGPSPIPPWVVGTHVPSHVRGAVRRLLLEMHTDAEGQRLLARTQLARFVAVSDADYDPIRELLRHAEQVTL